MYDHLAFSSVSFIIHNLYIKYKFDQYIKIIYVLFHPDLNKLHLKLLKHTAHTTDRGSMFAPINKLNLKFDQKFVWYTIVMNGIYKQTKDRHHFDQKVILSYGVQ